MFEVNDMTKHLMLVASSIDNYAQYLNKNMDEYSNILGIVYRLYQDKINKVSPQGLALIIIMLKDKEEKDYEKYIDIYKDNADTIIKNSKTVDEQIKKMQQLENSDILKLDYYDYELPERLIAQTPLKDRSSSKMLVLNKNNGALEHRHFKDIVEFLNEGDTIVLNDTKVIPARLIGEKTDTKAVIEVLLLKNLESDKWETLCKPAKRVKLGTIISFGDGLLKAKCIEIKDEGLRVFELIYDGILYEILDKLGTMPLPPYIHEKLDDQNRYQTVYAKNIGSAAAPTAGLHFTKELLEELKNKKVNIAYVTLHVGLGTFRPVNTENILEHHMHSEYYEISKETADIINKTKENNKRLVVVGTTSVRVLETVATKYGKLKEDFGNTDIFIYPGYKFKVVDNLITNFHLPKSTLVMLVSALAGRDNILNAYKNAINNDYRFFSFGDSLFIINK